MLMSLVTPASARLATLFADQKPSYTHISHPNPRPATLRWSSLRSGRLDVAATEERRYRTKEDTQRILWGKIYLLSFNIDSESFITIKYIQKADEDRFVRLVSHNPHHSPKDIPINSIQAPTFIKASIRINTMGSGAHRAHFRETLCLYKNVTRTYSETYTHYRYILPRH